MGELISIMDAAKELQVHPQTLRRFVKDGRLKAYRVPGRGNRFMIERGDLERLREPVPVGVAQPAGGEPVEVEPVKRKRRKSHA